MLNLKRVIGFAVATALVLTTPVRANDVIKLATTTSTENSGLLKNLLPTFEANSGYTVQVIATGTGKALKLARQGDVDVVMTHAPAAEAKFVTEGYGRLPRGIMENDFVVLGPKSDPAKIRSSQSAEEAFAKIAQSGTPFISRGDNSGTNMKELILWENANIEPKFKGYTAVGQGMGKTLLMTDELEGYTLSDRGTFVAYSGKVNLAVNFDGGAALANPYQIMLISTDKYPDLNHKGAQALSDWLISDQAQAMINNYKVQGEQLFKATYNK
ncbi:substrate-binding domain-containing protein [Shewanella youngdeokensis]|uniref:Substrate-binding domain-containing protein n=1 Tax=Shewanella youngdeokensis TaxID=2999068 RepID=A0ABZ0JYG7_9GAMM|nr:substrate-binding domain-containing protein [Shewanella sp. DAU334]